jgi:hypothetical protein
MPQLKKAFSTPKLAVLGAMIAMLVNGCESPSGVEFSVHPLAMRSCDPPKVAKITWDTRSAGVNTVQVFVVDRSGRETLFVHSLRRSDSWETGAWVRANTAFVLRDGDNGKELATVAVSSVSCGGSSSAPLF